MGLDFDVVFDFASEPEWCCSYTAWCYGIRANSLFRAHRYGPDHPALAGKDLDPGRFAGLTRLYGR